VDVFRKPDLIRKLKFVLQMSCKACQEMQQILPLDRFVGSVAQRWDGQDDFVHHGCKHRLYLIDTLASHLLRQSEELIFDVIVVVTLPDHHARGDEGIDVEADELDLPVDDRTCIIRLDCRQTHHVLERYPPSSI